MTVPMPYIPPNVYLLADNLDAALAAGEDLMKAELVWETGAGRDGADIARARAAQRSVLESVRSLEQILVARVLKSRERSEEIAKRDPRFATVARLYNAGTAILIEAVADFGDIATADFESGGGAVPFLRTRGLLADDSPGPTRAKHSSSAMIFSSPAVSAWARCSTSSRCTWIRSRSTIDLFDEVHAEPDLLPGETDPDLVESAPVQAAADTGEPEAMDDEADSEEVEALRKALLEVRSAVALDQR